jgi:hypothetical protein
MPHDPRSRCCGANLRSAIGAVLSAEYASPDWSATVEVFRTLVPHLRRASVSSHDSAMSNVPAPNRRTTHIAIRSRPKLSQRSRSGEKNGFRGKTQNYFRSTPGELLATSSSSSKHGMTSPQTTQLTTSRNRTITTQSGSTSSSNPPSSPL